jgi:hypothetical protein
VWSWWKQYFSLFSVVSFISLYIHRHNNRFLVSLLLHYQENVAITTHFVELDIFLRRRVGIVCSFWNCLLHMCVETYKWISSLYQVFKNHGMKWHFFFLLFKKRNNPVLQVLAISQTVMHVMWLSNKCVINCSKVWHSLWGTWLLNG